MLVKGADGTLIWDARVRLSTTAVAAACKVSTDDLATAVNVDRAQVSELFPDVPSAVAAITLVLEPMLFPKDPTTPPNPMFEWRGAQPIGGVWGTWFHPRTGEVMRPHFSRQVFHANATLHHVDGELAYYDVGINWVGESLRAGAALSHAVLNGDPPEPTVALTSVRSVATPATELLLSEGSDEQLTPIAPDREVLRMLNAEQSSTLIVENSVLFPTDVLARSSREQEVAGPVVVGLIPLPAPLTSIDHLIRRTHSGYPTNAFASRLSPTDVRGHLRSGELDAVARSVIAIAVTAFDLEGYVVWARSG